jgi:hypothetical protein
MVQCEAVTAKGTRCSRQAVKGSTFCAQHSKSGGTTGSTARSTVGKKVAVKKAPVKRKVVRKTVTRKQPVKSSPVKPVKSSPVKPDKNVEKLELILLLEIGFDKILYQHYSEKELLEILQWDLRYLGKVKSVEKEDESLSVIFEDRNYDTDLQNKLIDQLDSGDYDKIRLRSGGYDLMLSHFLIYKGKKRMVDIAIDWRHR